MPDEPTENEDPTIVRPPPPIITRTAFELDTGRLRHRASGPEGTIQFPTEPGIGWVDGQWAGESYYILEGAAVPRPTTGLPSSLELAAGIDWSIDDVPAGTVVLINGAEVGVVDDTGLTLSFALAGVWRVDLQPPFPCIEASCEVTVT